MNSPAAFQATYSDWKLIRSRKVVQIVLEVPIEAAGHAYDVLGGMPRPDREAWVACARIETGSTTKAVPQTAMAQIETPSKPAPVIEQAPARAPRQVDPSKRLARQAGQCCSDPVFWAFLREHNMMLEPNNEEEAEERATIAVRLICSVESRKDIVPGTPAADAWDKLVSKFIAWKIAA